MCHNLETTGAQEKCTDFNKSFCQKFVREKSFRAIFFCQTLDSEVEGSCDVCYAKLSP